MAVTKGLCNYGKSGVYMIKNIINGKFYIGSSCNIGKRWSEHLVSLESNNHHSIYMQRSFNKGAYFIFGIIEECNDLDKKEQYFIDTMNPSYNMTRAVRRPMLGRKLSDSHRNKISKANKGRGMSDKTRKYLSNLYKSDDYSDVYKKAGRRIGQWKKNNSKKILCVFLDGKEIIFNNRDEVVEFFGFHANHDKYVNHLCYHKRSVNGVKFEYKQE